MADPDSRFDDLPSPAPFPESAVIRELGEGLVLRRATPADVEALAEFNAAAQADPPGYAPDRHSRIWTRELAGGGHPRARAGDFAIVDDTRRRRIASSTALLSHRFRFEGVDLDVGQPELVGTHPDYRRRGLVRELFDVVHAWSEERGQQVQVIDGIPWFYRQFGYEFALDRLVGCRVERSDVPSAEGAVGYRARPASAHDVPLLGALYDRRCDRHTFSCVRDESFWRYELCERDPMSYARRELRILETESGVPVAAFGYYPILIGGGLFATFLEVDERASWSAVLPAILGALRDAAESMQTRDAADFERLVLFLGAEHPAYRVLQAEVRPWRRPSAYYVRVPDPVGLLQRLAPALERRLAGSALAGHTGSIELSFYRDGVRLVLEAGRIRGIEGWQPSTEAAGHVALPDLTYVQLFFGYRALDELYAAFPDCVIHDPTAAAVADALFPKRPSDLWLTW
jgi:hypothetical protein